MTSHFDRVGWSGNGKDKKKWLTNFFLSPELSHLHRLIRHAKDQLTNSQNETSKYPTFRQKSSMHNQIGPQGWFPKKIESFQSLGFLTEGM